MDKLDSWFLKSNNLPTVVKCLKFCVKRENFIVVIYLKYCKCVISFSKKLQ